MSTATLEIARKIAEAFDKAATQEEYLAALRRAKRLPRECHLHVMDEMLFAAFRLDLEASTGLPKRRVVTDRKGRKIPVEVR